MELEETVDRTWPDGIVRILRSTQRLGLIRAKLMGADAATGDVLVFLDAHCEVNKQWLVCHFITGNGKLCFCAR